MRELPPSKELLRAALAEWDQWKPNGPGVNDRSVTFAHVLTMRGKAVEQLIEAARAAVRAENEPPADREIRSTCMEPGCGRYNGDHASGCPRTSDVTAALAHRAVGNQEQDIQSGKIAGYCIVCQVQWPCDTAKHFLRPAQPPPVALVTEMREWLHVLRQGDALTLRGEKALKRTIAGADEYLTLTKGEG